MRSRWRATRHEPTAASMWSTIVVVVLLSPVNGNPQETGIPGQTAGTSSESSAASIDSTRTAVGEDDRWKAGLAQVVITPPQPVVLLGYGDRTKPFEAVEADIHAKALAMEDGDGRRAVIVTADLVGFQAAVITDYVCEQIQKRAGLQRSQLLFNASHTHTGPLVSLAPHTQANPVAHAPLTEEDVGRTIAYTHELREKLVELVCEALARLEPARLSWGRGKVDFPMNRRLPMSGRIVMSDNPNGSADRTVPILRVEGVDGTLRAVLFGCACHNTALTGKDNVIAGDYAGFAQAYVEARHPGAQAMFMSGCGADANPSPRGSLEIARQHGATLGTEVCRLLDTSLEKIAGDLHTAHRLVELPLQKLTRVELEERGGLPSAEAVMARHMLELLDSGESMLDSYPAPIAVWQFGEALTLVALPAEPVADYVALLGQMLGPDKLWVSGFDNDCFGYLPTAQIVREGGHEAIGVTLWVWGQDLRRNAGFFTADVETVVVNTVKQLAHDVGRPLSKPSVSAPNGPDRETRPAAQTKNAEGSTSLPVAPAKSYFTIRGKTLTNANLHQSIVGLPPLAPPEYRGGMKRPVACPPPLYSGGARGGAWTTAVVSANREKRSEEPSQDGGRKGVRVVRNVRIPMRDGITLAADIYQPDTEGRFPALVQLSYYVTGPGIAEFLVPRGYVCVLANSRGRGGSEGEWDPYVNEPRDGFDAQQWVAQQPWCTGKVGTFGQSYNAFTQTMSAPLANPHLTCMVPIEGQQSFFGHQYNDGVLQLNVVFTHGLFATGATGLQTNIPIRDPHFLQLPLMSAADKVPHPQAQRIKQWLRHARLDEHWKSFGVMDKYDRIQAPAYFVTGWYDNLVHENFRNLRGFREQGGSCAARKGTRLRVGPGVHGANPLPEVEYLRWYDYWMKGLPTGIDREAPLRIFVMGTGQWREEYEWPLARTNFVKFYLHSGGRANSVQGDGRLTTDPPLLDSPKDVFIYDPNNPVYTLGGQISTNPEIWGPQDRQSVQGRPDVLVYTTEPMPEDTEITGPVELRLFAASSAVDTDFTATLTDVHPDGRAIHICEGIRGVTFRDSLEQPRPIEPDRVYEYSISLWETSQVFAKGHRMRLEISSSNFPRYARNQNTGLPLGTSAEIKIATQSVFHSGDHASHLILPLIPACSDRAIRTRPDGSLRLTADTAAIRRRSADSAATPQVDAAPSPPESLNPTLKLAADAGVLGWWSDPRDEAEWQVEVAQAGRYRVLVNFACADEAAGNEFELQIGSSQVTGRVPGTGTWHDQREVPFGDIPLQAGRQSAVLRAAGEIRGALFDLRAIHLEPIDASRSREPSGTEKCE